MNDEHFAPIYARGSAHLKSSCSAGFGAIMKESVTIICFAIFLRYCYHIFEAESIRATRYGLFSRRPCARNLRPLEDILQKRCISKKSTVTTRRAEERKEELNFSLSQLGTTYTKEKRRNMKTVKGCCNRNIIISAVFFYEIPTFHSGGGVS